MKKYFAVAGLFVLLIGLYACSSNLLADQPKIIKLSASETKQAQSLAERRQEIAFERQQAQNAFQAQLDRLAEREQEVNMESAKLCFAMKKAHLMQPNANYLLDEWRGELRKQ
jgi:hypothetical protein